MKKLLLAIAAVIVGGGLFFAVRTVDRMAVSYMTGQRRVAGEGFFGETIPVDGPVPGYAFLGFTRPSEDPPGLRIVRPWEMAHELGLERGDVVTSVDGETFGSARELMSHLVQNYAAGEIVSVTAVTPGEAPRTMSMTLRAFVRHPGDLELPYEEVEIASDSGHTLRGCSCLRRRGATGASGSSCTVRTRRGIKHSKTAPSIGTTAATAC